MKEDRLPPVCDAVRLSDFLSPVMPTLWGRADGIGVGYGRRKDERNAKRGAHGNLPLSFVIVRQVTILRDDVKTSFVPPEQALLHSAFVPKYEVY